MSEREALPGRLREDDLELSRSYSDSESEKIRRRMSTGAYLKDLGSRFSTLVRTGFQRTEPEKRHYTLPIGSSLSSKRNAALSRVGKRIDSTSTDTNTCTDEDATTPAQRGVHQEESKAQEGEGVSSTTDGDKDTDSSEGAANPNENNSDGTANDKQIRPDRVLQCTGSVSTLERVADD